MRPATRLSTGSDASGSASATTVAARYAPKISFPRALMAASARRRSGTRAAALRRVPGALSLTVNPLRGPPGTQGGGRAIDLARVHRTRRTTGRAVYPHETLHGS